MQECLIMIGPQAGNCGIASVLEAGFYRYLKSIRMHELMNALDEALKFSELNPDNDDDKSTIHTERQHSDC